MIRPPPVVVAPCPSPKSQVKDEAVGAAAPRPPVTGGEGNEPLGVCQPSTGFGVAARVTEIDALLDDVDDDDAVPGIPCASVAGGTVTV